MPRAGQVKQEYFRRLSDVVSVGVVTMVFPADVVDEVIAVGASSGIGRCRRGGSSVGRA